MWWPVIDNTASRTHAESGSSSVKPSLASAMASAKPDEEGVATRDRVHPLDLRRCDVAPDQRDKLLADGRGGQAAQIDPPGDGLPGKSRDEDVGHVFGVPVVHHHQQPLASQCAHHGVQ